MHDDLAAHTAAVLAETVSPAKVMSRLAKLGYLSMQKHGSELHVAEIELSGLNRLRIKRRVPERVTLKPEVATWPTRRTMAVGSTTLRRSLVFLRRRRAPPSTELRAKGRDSVLPINWN